MGCADLTGSLVAQEHRGNTKTQRGLHFLKTTQEGREFLTNSSTYSPQPQTKRFRASLRCSWEDPNSRAGSTP